MALSSTLNDEEPSFDFVGSDFAVSEPAAATDPPPTTPPPFAGAEGSQSTRTSIENEVSLDVTDLSLLQIGHDHQFAYYITPKIIRATWRITVLIVVAGVLIYTGASAFSFEVTSLPFDALVAICTGFIVLVLVRISCELTMVFFNIARSLASIERQTKN